MQSKQRNSDVSENLSFVDFLKSLPAFHSVRVADLADMEAECPSSAYRCVYIVKSDLYFMGLYDIL